MSELKPCPFCGGEARINQYLDSLFWVRCFECGAEIQALGTEKEAAEAWNRRADECDRDALLELADELETVYCPDYGEFDRIVNRIREYCGVE